ncbi:DUF2737 family protein, partial [Escherichia coli]
MRGLAYNPGILPAE